jgi:hypothetical protein
VRKLIRDHRRLYPFIRFDRFVALAKQEKIDVNIISDALHTFSDVGEILFFESETTARHSRHRSMQLEDSFMMDEEEEEGGGADEGHTDESDSDTPSRTSGATTREASSGSGVATNATSGRCVTNVERSGRKKS